MTEETNSRIIVEATEEVDINLLTPDPQNPRNGDVEMIRESLDENDMYRSIVVNRGNHPEWTGPQNMVLAGNHTYMAALEEGFERILVNWVDVSDKRARKIRLVDNRANDAAAYDEQLLLNVLMADEDDLRGTGYDEEDISDLLERINDAENEDLGVSDREETVVVEPPDEPVSKTGDVWIMGDHRLAVGDASDAGVIEKVMTNLSELGDLVFTDPPYGVGYQGKRILRREDQPMTILNDEDKEGAGALVRDVFSILPMKPGCAFYICCPSMNLTYFEAGLAEAGYRFRQVIVWVKHHFALGHADYHWKHELILYGWAGGANRYFTKDRHQDTVWAFDKPAANKEHPTMKPVPLCEKAIRNSSRKGEIVLDPFGGSGSTLLACERSGRRSRLVEKDPRYADVVLTRYQAESGELPVLESTGEAVDFGVQVKAAKQRAEELEAEDNDDEILDDA